MVASSVLVIARRYSEYAVGGLLAVVVTQALGYGLIFDINFFLRNLSVVGGLLLVISDSWVRKKYMPAGLPQLDEKDRKMYVQLAGRVLLILLFVGFILAGKWSFWRVLVSLIGFVACVMVVVGFKAKMSAIILVILLSVFNVLVNNFWTVLVIPFKEKKIIRCNLLTLIQLKPHHPNKDFAKYDFFQVLSIVYVSSATSYFLLILDLITNDHQWRSPPPREYGSRSIQRRREEEGLLNLASLTDSRVKLSEQKDMRWKRI